MAKDKNSFILYSDLLQTVSKLTDTKAGKLFKMILEYVNDKNPETDDLLIQVAFEPVRQQLKRDLKYWEQKRAGKSEAGKSGGIKSGLSRRLSREQVYILSMTDPETKESFIKAGVTSMSVGSRYGASGKNSTTRMPYMYDIVYQFFPDNEDFSTVDIEIAINEKFSTFKHSPKKIFSGYMECYKAECLDDMIRFVEHYIEAKRSTMKQNEANEAVTVNGTVTDTVNVNVTDRENSGFWTDEANKKFSLSHCMEISLKDDGWVSRNKTNKAELQTFNEYLEKIADTEKTILDYKKHFANKKLKNPELFKNAKPAITKETIDAFKKAG